MADVCAVIPLILRAPSIVQATALAAIFHRCRESSTATQTEDVAMLERALPAVYLNEGRLAWMAPEIFRAPDQVSRKVRAVCVWSADWRECGPLWGAATA